MPDVGRNAPDKTHTQSLIFSEENGWTEDEARKWCKDNDYYVDGYEKTESSYRFRQYDPDSDKFRYRNKKIEGGGKPITLVIGFLKSSKPEEMEIEMKQGVFLRAMASDATEVVIDIVGVIGWVVDYQKMRDILRSIPENIKRVVFEIFSPGGDVWEGNGIIQEIGELNKRVDTVARVQVAASMATLIAVACRQRSIAANGRWMIHNAWTQTQGDAEAHEKAAQTLRDAEQEAAQFYAERTGGKLEDMLELMSEERWLMPDECRKLGFVQEVSDPFQPAEYEAVKQEIVAAGKWPKALIELPEIVKPEKEEENGDTNISGAEVVPTIGTASEVGAADEAVLKIEYERGKADGVSQGKNQAFVEFGTQIERLKVALVEMERLAGRHQSEKDKLFSQLAAAQKAADERAQTLRNELDIATAKLSQFVSGALTFSATVETWQEAMAICGGDYAKAATKYPQILEMYRAVERRKGSAR